MKSSAIFVRTFWALAVVGLVVAGGERVGAEHDPALDLGAEALARGSPRTSRSGRRRSAPEAVADAVVAGEVRRGLGRGDHVVGGDAVRRRAAARSPTTSPPSSSISSTVRSKTSRDAGLDALRLAGELLRDAEAAGPSGPRGSAAPPRPRSRPRSSRRGRGPRSAREQQGGVGDVAGQRAALVERGGEGDHPVARDRAVGGLQADDPAERGGLADRAAGVGADRAGREPPGDRGGRAARGAARDALAVPGVERPARSPSSRSRSPSRTRPCWSCRARRAPASRQLADRGRGVGRHVALEDPRAGGGRRRPRCRRCP